ncbi:hypothetical protein WN55_09499 [Dufourea novaeangliae]|uniref:Uncharacterized protein n=1 Tax=Dufourea novaeangliae TaxID=178035 RepID=A0A154P0N3_DUFNO|nr:hypothetical protein WN55_09499 [Dufourea novaeangliae]
MISNIQSRFPNVSIYPSNSKHSIFEDIGTLFSVSNSHANGTQEATWNASQSPARRDENKETVGKETPKETVNRRKSTGKQTEKVYGSLQQTDKKRRVSSPTEFLDSLSVGGLSRRDECAGKLIPPEISTVPSRAKRLGVAESVNHTGGFGGQSIVRRKEPFTIIRMSYGANEASQEENAYLPDLAVLSGKRRDGKFQRDEKSGQCIPSVIGPAYRTALPRRSALRGGSG